MMQPAIIFDIDGTLADLSHRLPLYKAGKKKEFFEKIGDDKPIMPVMYIHNILSANHDATILYVTGRMEHHRQVTSEWFLDNHLHCWSIIDDWILFMRKEGDYRDDSIVKKEIYEERIKGKYNVIAVFDDRPRVIKMWREQGLFVFNCAQHDEEF